MFMSKTIKEHLQGAQLDYQLASPTYNCLVQCLSMTIERTPTRCSTQLETSKPYL
jgi:hypothetical protein